MRIRLNMVMCSAFFLLAFVSCGLKESYKEFYIRNIDDYEEKDYFTVEELDFATVDNVVIEPEIREVHYDQYRIYISAHSLTGGEQVTINQVVLKDNQKIYFEGTEDQVVVFAEALEGVFEGTNNVGEFTASESEFSEVKELQLFVEIQIENGTEKMVKEICYDIDIIRYKSI